jgi:hypothetical protein
MKKLYTKRIIIGLSVIFSSVSGMEKKNKPKQSNKPHFNLTVKPIAGYVPLHKPQKLDLLYSHKMNVGNEVNKAIHFALVECKNKNNEIDQKAYQFFKTQIFPALPIDQFTHNKSYKITRDDCTINFISNDLYEENSFVPNHQYWQKALNSY